MSSNSNINISSKTDRVLEAGDTTIFNFKPEQSEISRKIMAPLNTNLLVRIGSINDGSSLLHSIAQACFKVYSSGQLKDSQGYVKSLDKRKFIRGLRQDLANNLNSINYNTGKTYYSKLTKLNNYNSIDWAPDVMDELLRSNYHIDDRFYEYISHILKVNLYFIDADSNVEIVKTGKYKNIVLYSMPNHFELIGYRDENLIVNCFKDNHLLIKILNKI